MANLLPDPPKPRPAPDTPLLPQLAMVTDNPKLWAFEQIDEADWSWRSAHVENFVLAMFWQSLGRPMKASANGLREDGAELLIDWYYPALQRLHAKEGRFLVLTSEVRAEVAAEYLSGYGSFDIVKNQTKSLMRMIWERIVTTVHELNTEAFDKYAVSSLEPIIAIQTLLELYEVEANDENNVLSRKRLTACIRLYEAVFGFRY